MIKRIKNYIYQKYLRYFRKYVRLSSSPYISGDTFRKYSDHIYDEIKKVDVLKIKKNDIVFVKTDYLDDFINNSLPHIEEFFILITHNSDYPIVESYIDLIGEKNIKWYGQNLEFSKSSDDRFGVIPIGLENRSYLKNGKLDHFKIEIRNIEDKKNRIYCSFNTLTNKTRIVVLNLAKQNNLVDFNNFARHKRYISDLNSYKFNLCPYGNGLDTHRFWESLIVNTIPIVKNSDFIQNFKNFNIPMLIVEDWKEIVEMDEVFLKSTYEKNYEKLLEGKYNKIDFWLEIIKKSKL